MDGTLIEAWVSLKSFRPDAENRTPPPGGGRNAVRDFHGEKWTNETHASATDSEVRLLWKGSGKSVPVQGGIDRRATRDSSYALSQRLGRALVAWCFTLTAAAYDLIRILKLLAATG